MKIEIVYALKEQQKLYVEEVAEGTTVEQAIQSSKLLKEFPELDVSKLGVFSKLVKPNYVLHEGDRIEVYRPLIADPKVKRREKAKIQEETI